MKLARCEYKEKIYHGIVKGEAIHIIDRSPYDDYQETETQFDLVKVRLLPPAVPTKFVCVGQNYVEHIKEIGATPPGKALMVS